MMGTQVVAWLWLIRALLVEGSQKAFSINDDVFAYPQYDINFPPAYVLEYEANEKLGILTKQSDIEEITLKASHAAPQLLTDTGSYERVVLEGQPYLCAIPEVKTPSNSSETPPSEEDQKKELIRAADRGWELLRDMEGKPCLFYSTGWWSYSFCYNSYVKQFHGLQPGTAGARVWPPQEDPTTPSYILGRYDTKVTKQSPSHSDGLQGTSDLQKKAETTYLVQRLEAGTPCDLTGEDRKVEIQYHCHPQSTDHIGWIKETSTCTYLMVVYTPRLCNDVAFQPPKDSRAHTISCHQILSEAEAASIQQTSQAQQHIEEPIDQRILLGNIELGGRQFLGHSNKKIEKGRIVMTAEEKADVVMMQKDGQLRTLSRTELKKLNLNPDAVEAFRKELQELAGTKDWKIERLDGDGQIQLRGIVSDDAEEDTKDEQETQKGSEEEYKPEGNN